MLFRSFVLAGFLGVSVYVLGWTDDEVTKGNVIGTWVNFAMLAVGFWLGSSSGGKVKDEAPPEPPAPDQYDWQKFGDQK